jgi:protoporphyrinogen oxidase
MKTGILGGGLTGLTVSNLLNEPSIILEKEHECGGLCRSLRKDGFTFDYGGSHIIFSKDKEALNYLVSLLGNNQNQRRRNTKIFYKGKLIKYPFENGLSDLPIQDNYECIYYYFENLLCKAKGEIKKPSNFEEWMYFTFGKGITEKYMLPYNRKIWNYEPKLMNFNWVDGRVPEPPVEDVLKSSLGINTEGYVHQLYFHYPITGGIQSIIKALEENVNGNIFIDFEVRSIKKNSSGKWIVSNGIEFYEFDRLISTIPLQEFVKSLEEIPDEVSTAIKSLKYNSLITVMLGINSSNLNDLSWLYIPSEEDGLFNRVSFPSNYSDKVAPAGKSSVLAEITCSVDDPIWSMSNQKILDLVTSQIDKLKFIDKELVCFGEVKRFKYAYVIYDLNYTKNMDIINNYFEKIGIYLIGRFSEFKYLNMDACVRSAMELTNKLNQNE